MKKHKTLGQVYTPKWIINEILDLVKYNNKNILNKFILEPSSGNGAFLLEIVKRYIEIGQKNQLSNEKISEGLGKYIYAVEIDKDEYKKSIKKLNILVKSYGINKIVNWNIYNENTLCFYKKYLNFFDYIVGNPPYIRIHNLDFETRKKIKNDFQFSTGTIDIYLSFFEMGFKMLNSFGYLGFITPNSYLHNSSYLKFREHLKQTKTLDTLIDFKANKVFDKYSTYTAISIFNASNTLNEFNYKEYNNNKIKLVNKIKINSLNNKNWSFTNRENEEFLLNLKKDKNSFIKDFFDVQYGVATLRDKIYIGDTVNYNANLVYFNDFLIEKDLLKKIIKGSTFKGKIDENKRILFPYELKNNRYLAITEEKLKEEYPRTYKYLLTNKKELENRSIDKGAKWFEFGRSQGIQTIHKEKIILSTLVNKEIKFYKIPDDVLMYSGLFITKKEEYSNRDIIENILNSREFYKYIRLSGKDFSGGYKSITSKLIKNFYINEKRPESLF